MTEDMLSFFNSLQSLTPEAEIPEALALRQSKEGIKGLDRVYIG